MLAKMCSHYPVHNKYYWYEERKTNKMQQLDVYY